jgi:hypothetical protein
MAAAAVSVVVPWRGGDPERERAWAYVSQWWVATHPGWQVVTGECPVGPWRKAAAVADALAKAAGELLVLADADVISPGCGDAAAAVAGGAPWAIPHRLVYRLDAEATQAAYQGQPLTSDPQRLTQRPYEGYAGGGLTVLTRETYEQVPLDPRFASWGQEDASWALALRALAGEPWRGDAPLWHLWHEPQDRLNRHVGNAENWALYVRYCYAAKSGTQAMRALIDEARGWPTHCRTPVP